MTACSEWRERLGEWLAGALDGEAATEVERHVDACEGCAAELAAMAALEEDLRALGPAPGRAAPPPRAPSWRAPAFVAAAAVLIAGSVFATHLWRAGPAAPGLPHGLYAGAVVEPAAGARLARLDDRGARLDRGAAHFHVQPRSGERAAPFRVETPLGTFTVLGTEFHLEVKEEGVGKAGTAVTIAVVAVVSGTVGYLSNDGAVASRVEAGERGTARPGAFEVAPAAAAPAPAPELAAARKELETVAGEKKALEQAVARKEEEVAALTAKLAEAEKRAEAAERAARAARPKPEGTLTIAFGPHSTIPEVMQANWSEMGEAAHVMTGLIGEIMEHAKTGEPTPMELQVQVARENMKLQKFAFAAMGKLPTHASGNGEFTHPIAMANLIAEHLRVANLPLSEAQMAEIARLGEAYDYEWERLQGTYGADTPRIEKVMDELEAKHRFHAKVLALLSPEQRAVIAPPEIHDRFLIDLHSPIILLAGLANPFGVLSADDLRKKMIDSLATGYQLPDDRRALVEPLVDRYIAEVAPRLQPLERAADVPYFHYDDAVVIGRASVRLARALPDALSLDDERRQKLLEEGGFGVPRLLPKK